MSLLRQSLTELRVILASAGEWWRPTCLPYGLKLLKQVTEH